MGNIKNEPDNNNPALFQREPAEKGVYFTRITLRDLFALAFAAGGVGAEYVYAQADDALDARKETE